MVNIDNVYNLLKSFANKDQSSGNVTPTTFNYFAPQAQMVLIDGFLNNPRAYAQAESQQPRKGYESSQVIIDTFSDLKVIEYLNVDNDGFVEEPNDYKYFSSARVNHIIQRFNGENDVIQSGIRVLRDHEVSDILSSEIDYPDLKNPCMTFYNGKWRIFPKTIHQIQATYLREPKTPEWGFNTVNEVPVYDSSNSQDFELPSSMESDLVYKMCQYTGVRMREDYLREVSTYLKNQDEI